MEKNDYKDIAIGGHNSRFQQLDAHFLVFYFILFAQGQQNIRRQPTEKSQLAHPKKSAILTQSSQVAQPSFCQQPISKIPIFYDNFQMIDHSKDGRDLIFLYDWMRIARKPTQSLRQDVRMLFDLISIPVSDSEIRIIEKSIDPAGTKTHLSKEDLLTCFVVEEECRKAKEKELMKAFKYISHDAEEISFSDLKEYLQQQDIDSSTSEMILKQLTEYETASGKFDYKSFSSNLY